MFEVAGVLRTWATVPVASLDQTLDVECDALADHRLAYLDYEGEIDSDRGRVIQVLSGEFRLLESSDPFLLATGDLDDLRIRMPLLDLTCPFVDQGRRGQNR